MHPLHNVIWKALTTRQAEFGQCSGEAMAFTPEVASLGAVLEPTAKAYESLAGLLDAGRRVTLALEAPYQPSPELNLVVSFPGQQMVYQDGIGPRSLSSSSSSCDSKIIELGAADAPEMLELTALTKPGPFNKRTHELGTYLGIRRGAKLVAMAGERLKVPGYTEVSAVCTHPDHTGKGLARALMTEVMRRILSRGETPFLHVREANTRAIELYQRLGFYKRVRLHMTVVRKNPS